MKYYFIFLTVLLSCPLAIAQQEERPLPPNINQPSINLYAPFISGNGKVLVYLSDYADDGHHTMYFATREGFEWEDGKEVNKLVNRPTLNFRGGYSLDYTGDRLYFTSRKSGLGGFDIWMSRRTGNDWSAPENLGAPLNSRENEGSPVVSPDGELMYFMRCKTMSPYGGAEECSIYVSEWKNNKWSEPVRLPDNINTGNSQTPRILGDGETLIFSSDKLGGKGGLDLFMTQKDGEGWTNPVPLDFINTEKDDSFISVPAKGRYAYISKKGARDYELVEKLIPDNLRPEKVMRISGTVNSPVPARLLVFDVNGKSRLLNEEIEGNKKFSVVLKEGNTYDISVISKESGYKYFGEVLELEKIGRIDRKNYQINLNPVHKGDTISAAIHFEKYELPEAFTFELRRLADFIRENPSVHTQIEIRQSAYLEDSVASSDLTEIRYDTLFSPPSDTVLTNPVGLYGRKIVWSGDSVDVIVESGDTLRYASEWFRIKKVFHNDRTAKQEEAFRQFMTSRGVDSVKYTVIRVSIPSDRMSKDEDLTDDDYDEEKPRMYNERLIAVVRE